MVVKSIVQRVTDRLFRLSLQCWNIDLVDYWNIEISECWILLVFGILEVLLFYLFTSSLSSIIIENYK